MSESTYQWMLDLRPDERERVERLLEEAPGHLHDANLVTISIQPIGGIGMHPLAPEVGMRQMIPVQGGIELLRWQLERMVADLIEAKSKAYSEEAK